MRFKQTLLSTYCASSIYLHLSLLGRSGQSLDQTDQTPFYASQNKTQSNEVHVTDKLSATKSRPRLDCPFLSKRAKVQRLEAMLEERQTPEEREAVALRERGYGPTSALANLRLFDAPEGTGMYAARHPFLCGGLFLFARMCTCACACLCERLACVFSRAFDNLRLFYVPEGTGMLLPPFVGRSCFSCSGRRVRVLHGRAACVRRVSLHTNRRDVVRRFETAVRNVAAGLLSGGLFSVVLHVV